MEHKFHVKLNRIFYENSNLLKEHIAKWEPECLKTFFDENDIKTKKQKNNMNYG